MKLNDWSNVLDSDFLDKMLAKVQKDRDVGFTIYPQRGFELRALEMVEPTDVKVVILGQDPYPNTDRSGIPHAMGLAFSSQSRSEIPASLKNIFKEIKDDVGVENTSGNLIPWVNQGVLLLNTCLTVIAGSPLSHVHIGWGRVTKLVLEYLSTLDTPKVFMLWGNRAIERRYHISENENHLILETGHPSPLAAHKSGFIGCRHFSKANDFLVSKGVDPIDWSVN